RFGLFQIIERFRQRLRPLANALLERFVDVLQVAVDASDDAVASDKARADIDEQRKKKARVREKILAITVALLDARVEFAVEHLTEAIDRQRHRRSGYLGQDIGLDKALAKNDARVRYHILDRRRDARRVSAIGALHHLQAG